MFDKHESPETRNGGLPHRDAAGESPLADRPLADREVPLPGMSGGSSMSLHQWLDGEMTESEARRVDSKQVEFWSRIATETDHRRRMVTPPHVAAQIMAALPPRTEATVTAAQRAVTESVQAPGLTPTIAGLIGAALFAAGILVGRMI